MSICPMKLLDRTRGLSDCSFYQVVLNCGGKMAATETQAVCWALAVWANSERCLGTFTESRLWGRRRINYIYKSLLLVFFLHQANINTSQTEKHRISNNTSVVSLHHSIREIHQNNNNQNNICFFHYQNTLSKRFIETERILHHCK